MTRKMRTACLAAVGATLPGMSCGNWTRSGPEGTAMTGRHYRAGHFYCFAAK